MRKNDLKDKWVLVLGASSGIGQSIVQNLIEANCNIIMHYNNSKDKLDQLQENKGKKLILVKFNVNDELELKKSIKDICSKYPIDILINCIGILSRSFISLTKKETVESVISTNLTSAFSVIKYISYEMIKNKRGVILNVSSLAGSHGLAGQSAYSASKAGLDALTRIAAKELSTYNIRVVGIAPGFIDAGILENTTANDIEYIEKIPLKRFGKASEVADLVSFLISDKASYITGQTIKIDGGLSVSL